MPPKKRKFVVFIVDTQSDSEEIAIPVDDVHEVAEGWAGDEYTLPGAVITVVTNGIKTRHYVRGSVKTVVAKLNRA